MPGYMQAIAQTSIAPGIIIGYREQEIIVREKLISPLENRLGITRIRPDINAEPPGSLGDTALTAMKRLKAGLESAQDSA